MRYLKLFGLAAVAAAALMAFVGAGSAPAETTLCKVTPASEPCPGGSRYLVNDELIFHGITTPENGENEHIAGPTLTGGFGNITCQSTIKIKITKETTPEATIAKTDLTWSECEGGAAETVTGGALGIHHDEKEPGGKKHDGTLTKSGVVIKLVQAGITCYYGGETTGTLTAGASPVIHTTATTSKIDNVTHDSSFFCPSTGQWHATYTGTSPAYVITGV